MKRALKYSLLLFASLLPCSGQVVVQPPADTSNTVLTIKPKGTTPGDLLDIYCTDSATTPCFQFQPGTGGLGVFTFAGNTATYGTTGQQSASSITLYGGSGSSAYLGEISAGLPWPSSPITQTFGGGGGMPQNTVVVGCITYTNGNGETPCSSPWTSTTDTLTLTHGISITPPSQPPTGPQATQWNYYALSCSAAPCTPSQLYLQGSSTNFGANQVFSSIPSSCTTGCTSPPSVNSTGFNYNGYWFISPSKQGLPCFSASAPYECAGGVGGAAGTVLMLNPLVGQGDMVVGGTSDLAGEAAPTRLQFTANGVLTSTASTPTWATGNPGQVLISNGSAAPTFQDPIVSQAYVTLFNAQSATGTATSSPVRIPNFSGYGTVSVIGAALVGSYSNCTIALAMQQNLGGAKSTAFFTTSTFVPSTSYQSFSVTPSASLISGDTMVATYQCSAYGTQGTISVVFDPITPTAITNTPSVTQIDGPKATYSATVSQLAVASGATDIFTIYGSSTKTIRVLNIEIEGSQSTSALVVQSQLLVRSTADTGGTSTTPTAVPHDSTSPAATATLKAYTANPTTGTLVGAVDSFGVAYALTTSVPTRNVKQFGLEPGGQEIVLRGTGQGLCLTFGGTTDGNSPKADIRVVWTEE